jgi:hypothetical protein
MDSNGSCLGGVDQHILIGDGEGGADKSHDISLSRVGEGLDHLVIIGQQVVGQTLLPQHLAASQFRRSTLGHPGHFINIEAVIGASECQVL